MQNSSISPPKSSSCPFIAKRLSPPLTQATTSLFSVPIVLPLPECHIKGTIEYVAESSSLSKVDVYLESHKFLSVFKESSYNFLSR